MERKEEQPETDLISFWQEAKNVIYKTRNENKMTSSSEVEVVVMVTAQGFKDPAKVIK